MDAYRQSSSRSSNDQAMSTEEFYRELFAKARAGTLEESGALARPPAGDPEDGVSEAFFHRLFAEARQGKAERLELKDANGPERDESRGKAELIPHDKKYWTFLPKPTACAKCQAMKDLYFEDEPERPHPNCKCELKTVKASELPYDRNRLIVPPGVSLEANLAEARGLKRRALELAKDMITNPGRAGENLRELKGIWDYFIGSFEAGGTYDYKQYGKQYEPFGNYHYGAYSKVLGWPEIAALMGAGGYQFQSGNFEWKNWRYYFDYPEDQYNIQRGMDSIQ